MQKDAYARSVGIGELVGTSLLCLLVDLFTKNLLFTHASSYTNFFRSIERVFTLTQFYNTGATFSIPLPIWLLVVASIGFLAWLLVVLTRFPRWWSHHPTLISTGFILGGALGNLFDRISLGYVRDWILIGQTSALNLADLFVIIGSIGLVVTLAKSKTRQRT